MKKLFLPPGSKVIGDQVTLSNGDVVPKWVLIAVPARKARPIQKQSGVGREPSGVYVDVVTGAVTNNPPKVDSPGGTRSGAYDFSKFSRYVPREKFNELVSSSIPTRPVDDSESTLDPGYFEQVDAAARPTYPIDEVVVYPISDVTPLGSGYVVRDALIWEGRPQELAAQGSKSPTDIVLNMRRIVVNVLDRIDVTNEHRDGYEIVLPWKIVSWFVDSNYWTPDQESHVGAAVRIEFTGSREDVYKKAVDLATKLSFDRLYLDYRSDGKNVITIVAPDGETSRRVCTRYDDVEVSTNRLICASGTSTVKEDQPLTVRETAAEVQPDPKDDYYSLYIAMRTHPEVYGGITQVQNMLRVMGFPANPMLSGRAGFTESAGTAATAVNKDVMNQLTSMITCPPTQSASKLFPTSSHAGFRGLNDHTQLDDGKTQDTMPYTVRTNNPLKVKTVKGVTDLKDRYGYLGDADGVAVYRDHVGGAAAGIAYLMQMSGSTVASAAKSVLGNVGGSDDGSDITNVTMSKVMQTLGQSLFGVADPSGAVQECATITDDVESLVTTAASMSASLLGIATSPLTKNEWTSAYQIAKNEPKDHITKSSTGLALPVTERDDTKVQPTGSRTESQGKDAPHSVDEAKSQAEKWNPIANYAHYSSNVWGSNGSNWINREIVSYEQKTGATDTSKIGKKTDKEKLNQDPKTYATNPDINTA